ncbi:MAG: hypothetical protein FWG20_00725 [Candidatus Cloacimonetes bacterium]|nr:hypothetical protein [Candidatus Cloacimonadota bacterium]
MGVTDTQRSRYEMIKEALEELYELEQKPVVDKKALTYLFAIMLQESDGIDRESSSESARGFWQFQLGSIKDVLKTGVITETRANTIAKRYIEGNPTLFQEPVNWDEIKGDVLQRKAELVYILLKEESCDKLAAIFARLLLLRMEEVLEESIVENAEQAYKDYTKKWGPNQSRKCRWFGKHYDDCYWNSKCKLDKKAVSDGAWKTAINVVNELYQ